MGIISVLKRCVELDKSVLRGTEGKDSAAPQSVMDELVSAHLELAEELGKMEKSDFDGPDPADMQGKMEENAAAGETELPGEMRKLLLSEKKLLPTFAAKGDYEVVTLLTTFSCFVLARQEGEQMHSRRYMENVKRVHTQVNLYYGRDPKSARSCS